MGDPFVHLHVASGFSLRHGASPPDVLVERALEQEMDTLALTDRDGTYGAVRFAKACLSAGIQPVLGVDLALAPTGLVPGPGGRRRAAAAEAELATPVAGRRLPRPAAAAGHLPGRPSRTGWAAICRLVSATHLAGQRGEPVCSLDLVAEHAAGRGVLVLLGPASEARRAPSPRGAPTSARAVLDRWRELLDPTDVVVEVVNHRIAGNGSDLGLARRADGRSRRVGRGRAWCSSNVVRHADRTDAVTSTSSTPPDAWCRSTSATSTGATPRGSSSPARRWPPSPRSSAGWPGWGAAGRRPAPCWPAPARWPTGARSTRGPTSAWARCTSPSWR